MEKMSGRMLTVQAKMSVCREMLKRWKAVYELCCVLRASARCKYVKFLVTHL